MGTVSKRQESDLRRKQPMATNTVRKYRTQTLALADSLTKTRTCSVQNDVTLNPYTYK